MLLPKDRYTKSDHKAKAVEEICSDSDGGGVFTKGSGVHNMQKWLVDSGASSDMTSQKEFLSDCVPKKVELGDDRVVEALGIAKIHLKMLFTISTPKQASLNNVPKLACKLFSV